MRLRSIEEYLYVHATETPEKVAVVVGNQETKTGQYATGEEVLSDLAKDNEIVRDLLEWRQIVKLQNTYVDALPEQINPKTGRVHTDYMQAVAATGRLSSNNPNLQNIPIRTERGQKVRKAFVAREENIGKHPSYDCHCHPNCS